MAVYSWNFSAEKVLSVVLLSWGCICILVKLCVYLYYCEFIINPREKLRQFMEKYVCIVCGYVYDPEVGDPDNGVVAGTSFADLPEDWVCPLCGVGKDQFEKEV